MNITLIAVTALIALAGILVALLAVKGGKLKRLQEKLDSKEVELSVKQQELEVVRDIQEKFKVSKQKKAPDKVESPADGDSDTRLKRLNSMSDSESSS